ncbi:MAG: diacylglycerol kinase family protein [Verrucomicrobia bacterium]|nr:diacylglycerol kinase family protein [Verrucomicrobiota bacterium]
MKLAGIDLAKLRRSFACAAVGLVHVIATEQNMRLHFVVAALVAAAAAFFQVSPVEWAVLILCVAQVMAAEAINSALERLADRVSMEDHFLIKHAKDAAAGGVLIVSLGAAGAGLAIFGPRLWTLLVS